MHGHGRLAAGLFQSFGGLPGRGGQGDDRTGLVGEFDQGAQGVRLAAAGAAGQHGQWAGQGGDNRLVLLVGQPGGLLPGQRGHALRPWGQVGQRRRGCEQAPYVEGELRLVPVPARQHGDLGVGQCPGTVQHGQRQRLGNHLAPAAQGLQSVAQYRVVEDLRGRRVVIGQQAIRTRTGRWQ
nr:hypothetical protein [Streptomyces dysideae]